MTGLICPQVTGTIFKNDAGGNVCYQAGSGVLLLAAQSASTAAYVDVGGRGPATTVPTELGNTHLIPGVYNSLSTTFGLSNIGPLVLDGQGDLNAVFIFQAGFAGTGLTVSNGGAVSLINGAQACNVFWWVQTATIGTGATFVGNILALTSVTVANGSNIEGRLLAQTANVTLINDHITRPACVNGPADPRRNRGDHHGDRRDRADRDQRRPEPHRLRQRTGTRARELQIPEAMRTTGRPIVRRAAISVSTFGTSSNSTTRVAVGRNVPASSMATSSALASANISAMTSGG